jgi:hypothetical protein
MSYEKSTGTKTVREFDPDGPLMCPSVFLPLATETVAIAAISLF